MKKNKTLTLFCISAVLLSAVILMGGSSLQVPSGTWVAVGPMNYARIGASAVLLQDGRILVTGGNDANGPTNTAEFFGANGSLSLATPMNVPRSGHVAVVLQDGRVLVAGGTTSGGGVTNSAEIYDPTLLTWTNVIAGMVEARMGATAAVLQDGRVLIAGGQNGTVISSTIEIFDPNLGGFAVAGQMSSPRTQHAMTVLQDGRVLIVGGNNGTAPVASTDIFDPVANAVSAGPSLSVARFGHSATTLLNGQVVVIGGNNGNTNPAQMDMTPAELVDFTAATPAFTTLASNLATPREGHLAFLLPNNNSVLIAGGTSGGVTVASAELFTPQESPAGAWTYGFASTGTMNAARSNATGAANQVNTTSTVMQRNGVLLVAGGTDASGNALNSAEAYGFATVQTDAADYPPGTTVNITGSGWVPGETVTIQLVESPLIDTHGPYTVTADANGNIADSSFTTDLHDVDVKFTLTAVGSVSQAQTTFTDSSHYNAISVASQTGTATYGTATSPTFTVTAGYAGNGSDSNDPVTLTFVGWTGTAPTGVSTSFSPTTVSAGLKTSTLTITTSASTPAGTYTFTVKGTNTASTSFTNTGTLTVNQKSVTASVTASNKTYDGTNTATIATCTLSGVLAGDASNVTCAAGSATFSDKNVGTSKTVTATGITLSGSAAGNYVLSSTTATTTANITTAALTATLTPASKTYDGTNTEPNASMSCSVATVLTGDTVNCAASSGTFNSKDVLTATQVAATVTISGASAGNYTLGAAGTTTTSNSATATAHIAAKALTMNGLSVPTSKAYDGTTAAVVSGTATLQGTEAAGSGTTADGKPYSVDSVSLTGTATGTYNFKDVATATTVTFGGVSLTGTGNGDYTLTASTQAATITAKALTMSGLTAPATKVYDGTTTATVSGTAALQGTEAAGAGTASDGKPYSVDSVSLTGTDTGTYNSKNVLTATTVTFGGVSLTGTGNGDYTLTALTQPATITAKALTITGLTASAKVYDATTTGTLTGTAALQSAEAGGSGTTSDGKPYSGDTVSVTGTPSGTFASANVASGISVSVTGLSLSGAQSGNYQLGSPQATTTANITAKALTVTGLSASNKVYDGTIAATLTGTAALQPAEAGGSGTTSDGKPYSGDTVSVTGTPSGTFASANVANGISVSVTGLSLNGAQLGNYSLTSPSLTANITQATPTVTVTGGAFTYDTNAHAATAAAVGVDGHTAVSGSFSYTYTPPGTSTAPINAGTYTVGASFTSTDPNYANTTGSGSIVINKATPTFQNLTASQSITYGTASISVSGKFNAGAGLVPSGMATVTIDSAPIATSSSFNGNPGNFSATVNTSTISASATPFTITYSYAGDSNFNSATDISTKLTVNKATATVVVAPYTVTYDGNAHTATVTSITGVNGETGATVGAVTLNTTHTAAGTYASDTWSFTGAANYNNIAATTITDTINKATATVVVTPYTVTYDGNAHTATVTSITGVNGETGATVGAVTLNTTHTAAGTYASDTWSFTGAANYNNIAATTITDTINKATATVVVTPYTVTYNGQPHTAAVTSITGVNGETGTTVGTVDVSNTTHTAAGTYASDSWSFTGTANYSNIAATTITDTINKATATVVVAPYAVTYDGNAHTAAVTSINGVNGEIGTTVGTVNVSNTTHTNAATYASDSWSFTGAANYNDIASTTITDTINKADATVVITPYSGTYDALPHSLTGTAKGVGGVDLSASLNFGASFTNVPGGTATWTFTGGTNYYDQTSTAAVTINKANATINVTPYSVTYDGNPHTATATATGVGSVNLIADLDLGHTAHTSAGTYSADYWTFTDPTGNYNNVGNTTITDIINQAPVTITVTDPNVTYDGNPHTATIVVLPSVSVLVTYNGSPTAPTSASVYAVAVTVTDPNYTGIGSGTLTINQATPSVTWATPADITYGTPLSSTQLNATSPVPGAFAYAPAAGTVLNAAPAQALSAIFTPADTVDYTAAPASVKINVNQATPLIVWNNPADITYGTALGNTQLNAMALPAYSLKGWWKAEGDATDSVGGNSGTLQGRATYTTGEAGQAFSFPDASGDGVTIPYKSAYDLNAPGFTASFWMKGSQNANGQETVLEKSYGLSGSTGWAFQVNSSTGKLEFDIGQGNASPSFTQVLSSGNVLDGNFHLIVGTWDGGTKMTLYVDGISQGTATLTAAPANNNGGLNIGFSAGNGTPGQYFQGAVDEVQIFGQAVPAGTFTYTPASGTVLNAGNAQTLSVTFAPTDTTDLNPASSSVSINVKQAAASITVTPYSVTYDGNAHTATATATGVGGVDLSVGLTLTGTTHTNAGTYATDAWSFHDATGNYADASGTVSDSIAKANATFTVTPYTVTYDGNAHTATVTSITGVNGEMGATVGTVDVSNTTHTNAGTYASDSWSFTGAANYNNIASTTISDTINKATATVVVTPYTVTYDGSAHTATVTSITGVNGETGATVGMVTLNTTHTNAGTYASDSWSFTGAANYNDIISTTISDTINKATATVVVTPYTVTYDGSAHTATVTSITGVNGETGATVGMVTLNTTHTNAGTYASDSWSFTGAANYNNIASTTITDTINKATATVVVTPYTVTYDGNPHTATGTATGVKGETLAGLNLTGTTHTNAGTYGTDPWTFTDVTGNYNNATGTVSDGIAQAPTTTAVVSSGSPTAYGQLVTLTATVSSSAPTPSGGTVNFLDAGVTVGSGTVSGGIATFSTFVLPPGSDSITAQYLGTANYSGSTSAPILQTVTSVPVVSIDPSSITFPGQDVGAASAAMPVILTNIGTASLNISNVQIIGSNPSDFLIASNTCSNSLPWGPPTGSTTVTATNSCVVTVKFNPQDTGIRTATLVFTDNDGGSVTPVSQYISLTGSALSAVSTDFKKQPIAAGTNIWFSSVFSVKGPNGEDGHELNMSQTKIQVFVTNGTITFTNPSNNSTVTLPVPDALITFDPTATQASTTFDASTGMWRTTVPAFDPVSKRQHFDIDGEIFASGLAYQVPAGGLPGGIKNVTWSASYSTDTPGVKVDWEWGAAPYTSLGAGSFGTGTYYNSLNVKPVDNGKAPCSYSNEDGAATPEAFTQYVTLGATADDKDDYHGDFTRDAGVIPSVTPVTIVPSPVVFATPLAAGVTSGPMAVTITNNNQTLTLNVSTASVVGANAGDFAVTGTTSPCNTSGSWMLAAGASCTFSVTFTPSDLGTRTAALSLTYAAPAGMDHDDAPPPQKVDLYGTGAGGSNPIVGLSAVSLNFGYQEQGTSSSPQTVILVNAGGGPLNIGTISVTSQYSEKDTCAGSTVLPGATCTITATFSPSASSTGALTGVITIADNNNGVTSTQSIALSGKATR